MRQLLFDYLLPTVALLLGLLAGVLPPPSVPALWAVSIFAFLVAFGFIVYSQGWVRAGIYLGIAAVFSFCAEFTLVNPMGLLTHFTYPQLGGVSMLALLQDVLVIATAYIFASALLASRGILATAACAATIAFVTALVAGPWGTTLGYYIYNQPFHSWPDSLGLREVPPVPWGEPLGLAAVAFVTTSFFEAIGSLGDARRRLSPKWAAVLYFSSQALPGWAWAGYTERWELFGLGTVLLAALAAFSRRCSDQGANTRATGHDMMGEVRLRTYAGAVAIVTGGASGLGRALGEELARRGAEVVLADRQADLAAEAAAGIRANGGKAQAVSLDVTDFAAVDRLVHETVAASGRLDYMFNNAGIVVAGEAHLYQIQDWLQVVNVNLCGVANGVQAAYPIMRQQGFGHIVNTASIAGLIPMCGLLSYSASKHAVVGLSTSLRMEAGLAGVRVSVLCPGAVDTPIVGGGKFGRNLQAVPETIQRRVWEQARPMARDVFARQALDAIARNKAIIVLPWRWRVLWRLYRACPSLIVALLRRQFAANKKLVEENLPASLGSG